MGGFLEIEKMNFIRTVSDYGYLQTSPTTLRENKIRNRHLESHRYLRALSVAVGLRHGVTVRPAVLAVVRAVRRGPGLIVHGAVETLWDGVLGKNVGVEEYLKKVSTK